MALTAPFTLRQLHYFVTAARAGQISAAASQAHISQSAMTTAIAELERLLGAPLFERSHQGITLTYDGHAFLQQAEAVLEMANEAARFPFHRRTDVSGRLEVAATYTVLGYFLLPALAKFRKLFPLVEVVPVEMTRTQIEQKLLAGKIELAVALLTNLTQREQLHTLTLARSRRQLWVASDHPLIDSPTPVNLQQISQYPYIFLQVDEGARNSTKYWDEAGLRPVSGLTTTSMEALREMVALGLGVTILSDMVFRPWSLDGRRIQTLSVDWPLPAMEIGMAWKQDHLSSAAAAFREFLTVSGTGASHDV